MRRLLLAPLAALALVPAACGQEEASVVDRALDNPVRSAQVSMRFSAEQGGRSLGALEVRGPMRSNGPRKLESFDWRVRLRAPGERPVSARVVSTGRNVLVTYRGTTYEVGEDEVAKLQRQQAQGGQVDDLEDVSRLGVDLKAWFPESDAQQDATAAGVPTDRVTGRLDVSAALRDVARLMRRPEFQAQLGAEGIQSFGEREIRMIDRLTTDPRFELHVGRDDGKLRRLAASVKVADPQAGAGQRAGLRFVLELRNVDRPVTITAPQADRPIEDLLESGGVAGKAARSAA